MSNEFQDDLNRGWFNLKRVWETLSQEHRWKVLFLISFGCNLGQFFF